MKYKITEEQLRAIHEATSTYNQEEIEEWYPELFSTKLEVGKWYYSEGWLFNYQEGNKVFGFDDTKKWIDKNWSYSTPDGTERLATDREVIAALKIEATRRGYKVGTWIRGVGNGELLKLDTVLSPEEGCLQRLGFNAYIFKEGQWAEIVNVMTKKEVEEKFNITIV